MYEEHIRAAARSMAENMQRSPVPMYGKGLRLPDKGAVIGLLKEIRRLVFPAYYGDPELMTLPVEDYTALLLERIEGQLARQIALALPEEQEQRASVLAREVVEALPGVQRLLLTDLDATFESDPEAFRQEILSQNKAMADQALRVLAAAGRAWNQMPSSQEPDFLEQDLCFLGLCGMIDPVRPEVVDAIRECRGAGIRPVMITGDHKDTAVAIAKELGILEAGWKAVTGAEIDQLSDEELDRRIEEYAVYARVQPEHKVRIVDAWKRKGRITAMTGDGVNDAPSIKRADIGIGMGITGTDVTKNVADMVLADDNFATIIAAVEEGRRTRTTPLETPPMIR